MSSARIFSAPSLSAVIQQLMLNRLSGLLTFRRATGTYQDEASILVGEGQPLRLRWRGYEREANESILRQLDAWGEIHFLFLPREAPRLLPPPSQSALQGPFQPHHSLKPTQLRYPPSVTQPLPVLRPDMATHPLPDDNRIGPFKRAAEVTLPSLTAKARDYPFMNVPRYDRTIFLLINGSRTIADLAHLTKRSLSAVYGSLSRLRELQLIEVSL